MVDVWWATVEDAHPALIDLLPSSDIERIHRFRRQIDRDARLVGWSLARRVLSDVLDQEPKHIAISQRCRRCGSPDHGKPRVDAAVSFSLSHSGDRVLLAVSGTSEVGADVEQGPVSAEIASMVLAPGEADGDLLRYWVRKEAVLKATGDGLSIPMTDITVTDPSAAPALLRFRQHENLEEQIQLADLDAPAGFAAAVAVIGQIGSLNSHDGSALLKGSRHE